MLQHVDSVQPATHFHFFTDSVYVQDRLTSHIIPELYFYTVQDIFHLASYLKSSYSLLFTIHKISGHLESKTMGYCSTKGSMRADVLANDARPLEEKFHIT